MITEKKFVREDNEFRWGNIITADRILVLAPHCDDEILGFGGNILNYLDEGKEVKIIYLTNNDIRKNEAKDVWRKFRNVSLIFANIEDGGVYNNFGKAKRVLIEIINSFKPNIIATPWMLDKHIDHACCSVVLSQSLRETNNTDLKRIVSYEVNFPLFVNYCVNISRYFNSKIELIKKYISQKPEKLINTIECLNKYRGAQVGLRSFKYVEALYICTKEQFISFVEHNSINVLNGNIIGEDDYMDVLNDKKKNVFLEYINNRAEICFLGSISNILNFYDVNISEAVLLGVTVGISIRVKKNYYKSIIDINYTDDDYYLESIDYGRDFEGLNHSLEKIGCKLVRRTYEDVGCLVDDLVMNSKKDILAIVVCDIYYLEYHIEYRKRHRGHFIVILAIEQEKGRVYIADNYISSLNGDSYCGWISLREFKKAVVGDLIYTNNLFTSTYVIKVGNKWTWNYYDIAQKNRQECQKFLGRTEGEHIEGLSAIKDISASIEHISECMPCKEYNDRLDFINLSIVGLAGPVASRKLYASFLEWLSLEYNLEVSKEIIEEYIEISKKWKLVATLLIKASRSSRYDILKRGIRYLEDIYLLEEKNALILEQFFCISAPNQ